MSRGLIVNWIFNSAINNRGVIAGCSPDVHGTFFSFVIGGVSDASLANFLRTHPQLSIVPDCSLGPSVHWVSFTPVGQLASSIQPAFHGVLDVTPDIAALGFAPQAPQPGVEAGPDRVSDSTGTATLPEVITAQATALTAHAEAASRHAEAAALHASAAEAHAREAARYSEAVKSIGESEESPASNDSNKIRTSTEINTGNATAKRKARGGVSRKRR